MHNRLGRVLVVTARVDNTQSVHILCLVMPIGVALRVASQVAQVPIGPNVRFDLMVLVGSSYSLALLFALSNNSRTSFIADWMLATDKSSFFTLGRHSSSFSM